jgi:hypothetical protein
MANNSTDAKLLLLTWTSMTRGRLPLVLLKTQVMTTLNKRQKSTNERMLLGFTPPFSRPHSVRNRGRCHPAHSAPRIKVPKRGPCSRWWRTSAKSRQPGSSASPVVTICNKRNGT